jgi:threonine/homoserine/homoserine lactone efflux protein
MYRFNKTTTSARGSSSRKAVELDPTFARAYAGLSFAHFQNAFLGWKKAAPEIDRAFDAAGKSLMVDDRDPAAHWAMGRALWLRGGQDQAVKELERAVDLSPNYATAHYTLAFVHSQSGDPNAAISFSDHARQLVAVRSDAVRDAGSRALSLARLGQHDEAAEWAMKAAARPNAHQHIMTIAALTLGLAGRLEEANAYKARIRERVPTTRWRISSRRSATHPIRKPCSNKPARKSGSYEHGLQKVPGMMPAHELLLFALAAFVMVLTPGPNMIYLVSRSLCQGRKAAVISLFGVATGFLLHMFSAAAGLTAMFMAIPLGYEILKWLGAAYLLWLAWQAVRPGAGSSPFEARALPADSPARLFSHGVFDERAEPQDRGVLSRGFPAVRSPRKRVGLSQSIQLGLVQISVSFSVNLVLVLTAARLAAWFARNPLWLAVQRWVMGFVLGGLAVRLALDSRRN